MDCVICNYFDFKVIPDSNTTLVLSLHHPQAQVREMAVKRLGDLLTEKEVKVELYKNVIHRSKLTCTCTTFSRLTIHVQYILLINKL